MGILQKNKKVAAGIGVAAAAAAAIALGTGTYAAFTDTQTGPGGTLTAGSLNLDLTSDPADTATILDESNIYPGKVLEARTVTVRNGGSVDGVLTVTGSVNAHGGHLQDQLTVSVNCTSTNRRHSPYVRTDEPLATAFPTTGVPLTKDETVVCSFRFTLPDRPDNNLVQGDKLTIASTFTLTQATP